MNGYIYEGNLTNNASWIAFEDINEPVKADKVGYYSKINISTFDDLFRFFQYVIYPHFLTGVPLVVGINSFDVLKKQLLLISDPLPIGCSLTAEKLISHLERFKRVEQLPDKISYHPAPDIEHSLTLDDKQIQAATHYTGVATVIAPAGSGKTATIIARCTLLLKRGVKPQRILTITFTKKAQLEMQQRLAATLGDAGKKITVKTFHALAYMLIGVLDKKKPEIIMDRFPHIVEYSKENGIEAETLDSFISFNLNSLTSPDMVECSTEKEQILSEGYRQYLEHLGAASLHDQDYLLYKLYLMLRDNNSYRAKITGRWQFIMVDESQDNNLAQEVLSHFLAAPWDNLYYVFDDDQLLYAFRGSSVERILSIDSIFPNVKEIALQTNYRSHPAVVLHANLLIKNNVYRRDKNTGSGRVDIGESLYPIEAYKFSDIISESKWVARKIKRLIDSGVRPNDIAILYRTNAQSDLPANELHGLGVPYYVHQTGKTLFESAEAETLLGYMDFLKDQNDIKALSKILKFHSQQWQELIKAVKKSRYVVDDLRNAAQDLEEVRVLDFCNSIPAGEILFKSATAGKCVQYIISSFNMERIFGSTDNSDRLGIIGSVAEKFNSAADFLLWVDKIKTLPNEKDGDTDNKVQLMTVHSSKGMEFPYVFLINLTEGHMPHSKADDLEEERRIAYVGITRAKDYLVATGYEGTEKRISRFMYESMFTAIKLPNIQEMFHSYLGLIDINEHVVFLENLYELLSKWSSNTSETDKGKTLYEILADNLLKNIIVDERLYKEPEGDAQDLAVIAAEKAKAEFALMGEQLMENIKNKLKKYKEAV